MTLHEPNQGVRAVLLFGFALAVVLAESVKELQGLLGVAVLLEEECFGIPEPSDGTPRAELGCSPRCSNGII
jgi:hypothetical protein